MKSRNLGVSAAILIGAGAAAAAPKAPAYDYPIVKDLKALDSKPKKFGERHGPGRFNDYYTFTIASPTSLFSKFLDANISSVSVRPQSATTWMTDSIVADGFTFLGLAPGAYYMRVSGMAADGKHGGRYHGSIQTIASPAPEPETYLMMMLGLAGVALAVRRHRKAGQSEQDETGG